MEVKIKDQSVSIIFRKGKDWMSLDPSSGPCKLFVISSEQPYKGYGIDDKEVFDFLNKYIKDKND